MFLAFIMGVSINGLVILWVFNTGFFRERRWGPGKLLIKAVSTEEFVVKPRIYEQKGGLFMKKIRLVCVMLVVFSLTLVFSTAVSRSHWPCSISTTWR